MPALDRPLVYSISLLKLNRDDMNYFFAHLLEEFHLPLKNPVLVFSLLLFIILLSPILLRKIRIPAIIGLIISGVIIGPHGMGLIGEKTMEAEGSIKLFSTIGLLYIMFMAGLELDMTEFKKYFKKSVVFGALTFLIPISLGYPICRYALGLSEVASWLTASMFATHTLVAYPIINKFGLSKSTAASIAIGGTILTDTAVLVILAVISSSVQGDLDMAFWLRLITSLLFFSLIMFLIIPRIARWFFSKLESENTSQYIFVLSIIFFAAFLAEVAGIEHIIGAFVAGLVLNRLIPHSSPLMNRVEFIGNSLFIPFFLIFVGMVVDYRVLFEGPWALIIAAVLTTFAITSKWLAALATQLIFKMTKSERQVIFGLSTAHAAATLAVIMVGFEHGILDINIVNGTILLILITCLTASFVTENAGKRLLKEQAENEDASMSKTGLGNQHLLLAINELKGNELILDFCMMITNKKVINPISVVSVLPNNEEAEYKIRLARKELDEVIKHFSANDSQVNVMATIDLNLSSGIARVSKELVTDIVVLNDSSKMNLLKRIVGDDRDHLLDVCDKTIFFCSLDKPAIAYERIVVICPVDSELEGDFKMWSERIMRLSKELNKKVEVYSSEATFDKWEQVAEANKIKSNTIFKEIESIDDFFVVQDRKNENDLIVVCAARKGSVSYSLVLDQFLSKMDKGFAQNDSILIFPAQNNLENLYSTYDDFDGGAITKGVEAIQKIGKEVGSIFKKI